MTSQHTHTHARNKFAKNKKKNFIADQSRTRSRDKKQLTIAQQRSDHSANCARCKYGTLTADIVIIFRINTVCLNSNLT